MPAKNKHSNKRERGSNITNLTSFRPAPLSYNVVLPPPPSPDQKYSEAADDDYEQLLKKQQQQQNPSSSSTTATEATNSSSSTQQQQQQQEQKEENSSSAEVNSQQQQQQRNANTNTAEDAETSSCWNLPPPALPDLSSSSSSSSNNNNNKKSNNQQQQQQQQTSNKKQHHHETPPITFHHTTMKEQALLQSRKPNRSSNSNSSNKSNNKHSSSSSSSSSSLGDDSNKTVKLDERLLYVLNTFQFVVSPSALVPQVHPSIVRAMCSFDEFPSWHHICAAIFRGDFENWMCPVCLSPPLSPRMLHCGHVVCSSCWAYHVRERAIVALKEAQKQNPGAVSSLYTTTTSPGPSSTATFPASRTVQTPEKTPCPVCSKPVHSTQTKPVLFVPQSEPELENRAVEFRRVQRFRKAPVFLNPVLDNSSDKKQASSLIPKMSVGAATPSTNTTPSAGVQRPGGANNEGKNKTGSSSFGGLVGGREDEATLCSRYVAFDGNILQDWAQRELASLTEAKCEVESDISAYIASFEGEPAALDKSPMLAAYQAQAASLECASNLLLAEMKSAASAPALPDEFVFPQALFIGAASTSASCNNSNSPPSPTSSSSMSRSPSLSPSQTSTGGGMFNYNSNSFLPVSSSSSSGSLSSAAAQKQYEEASNALVFDPSPENLVDLYVCGGGGGVLFLHPMNVRMLQEQSNLNKKKLFQSTPPQQGGGEEGGQEIILEEEELQQLQQQQQSQKQVVNKKNNNKKYHNNNSNNYDNSSVDLPDSISARLEDVETVTQASDFRKHKSFAHIPLGATYRVAFSSQLQRQLESPVARQFDASIDDHREKIRRFQQREAKQVQKLEEYAQYYEKLHERRQVILYENYGARSDDTHTSMLREDEIQKRNETAFSASLANVNNNEKKKKKKKKDNDNKNDSGGGDGSSEEESSSFGVETFYQQKKREEERHRNAVAALHKNLPTLSADEDEDTTTVLHDEEEVESKGNINNNDSSTCSNVAAAVLSGGSSSGSGSSGFVKLPVNTSSPLSFAPSLVSSTNEVQQQQEEQKKKPKFVSLSDLSNNNNSNQKEKKKQQVITSSWKTEGSGGSNTTTGASEKLFKSTPPQAPVASPSSSSSGGQTAWATPLSLNNKQSQQQQQQQKRRW